MSVRDAILLSLVYPYEKTVWVETNVVTRCVFINMIDGSVVPLILKNKVNMIPKVTL